MDRFPRPYNDQEDQEIGQFIDRISSMRKIRNQIPVEWQEILRDISEYIKSNPNESDNNELITYIYKFAMQYEQHNFMQIINSCLINNIGYRHALFRTAIAISYERNGNFISAINEFEMIITDLIEPTGYVLMQYAEFKKRMCTRLLKDTKKMNLGQLDGVEYIYDGDIKCYTVKSHQPCEGKYDFFNAINFDMRQRELSTQNSATPKFNDNSGTSSKLWYLKKIITAPDGSFQSFEEARFLAMPKIVLPKKAKKAKNASIHEIEIDENEISIPNIKPKSILKKQKSPTRNSSVKFGAPKHKAEPSIQHDDIKVGDTIQTLNFEGIVEMMLGESCYLCVNNMEQYAVKPMIQLFTFTPQNPELFLLPSPDIHDYYVAPYIEFSLKQVIDACHAQQRGFDEPRSYHILLQMIRIVRNLEEASLQSGVIDVDHLRYRISRKQLTEFNDDDECWKEQGLALCHCDKLGNRDHSNMDRLAVASLFHFMVTKEQIQFSQSDCPNRWNSEIWNSAFQCLRSNSDLKPLEQQIVSYLEQGKMAASVKSSISRLTLLLNSF